MAETADLAKEILGDKLYQKRARQALPILVRQAEARAPIKYEDLAAELQMPNPRNLNYPLGNVGAILGAISKEWGTAVPHLQSLVINKNTGLPGSGFDFFLAEKGFSNLTKQKKKEVLDNYWAEIYAYPYWDDVLKDCSLQRVRTDIPDILKGSSRRGGRGEGPEHLALKEYVCANPSVVALNKHRTTGTPEHRLPSADVVDVLFHTGPAIKAVEIKSHKSDEADIARGLFQCVKYKAILEAESRFHQNHFEISVCLVLGGRLPERLIPLKNSLAISVFENVRAIVREASQ